MVRTIPIRVDDSDYERLKDAKGGRTWKEVLADGCEVEL